MGAETVLMWASAVILVAVAVSALVLLACVVHAGAAWLREEIDAARESELTPAQRKRLREYARRMVRQNRRRREQEQSENEGEGEGG